MAFVFECSAVTHIGNRRKNNEDNFFIGELLTPEKQASMSQSENRFFRKHLIADGAVNRIFAVSDGMGGHENGEVASYMVCEALERFAESNSEKAARRRQEKSAYIQAFQEMIRQTNIKINKRSKEIGETDSMGATLSGIIIFANEIVSFNIGDSTVFLFEKGKLCKLTKDDIEAERISTSGSISAKDRRLTKYFGVPRSGGILTAGISEPVSLCREQIFLIASDGLTDALSYEDIAGILREFSEEPEKAVDMLLKEALTGKNGGNDNITVIILKVLKSKTQTSYIDF